MEKLKALLEQLISALKGILARFGSELGDDVDPGFNF